MEPHLTRFSLHFVRFWLAAEECHIQSKLRTYVIRIPGTLVAYVAYVAYVA